MQSFRVFCNLNSSIRNRLCRTLCTFHIVLKIILASIIMSQRCSHFRGKYSSTYSYAKLAKIWVRNRSIYLNTKIWTYAKSSKCCIILLRRSVKTKRYCRVPSSIRARLNAVFTTWRTALLEWKRCRYILIVGSIGYMSS